ncbi:hypothetical protein IV203_008353 [Nitzschia inconspicua]|uniref:Uncharacterized protein n=1 Tax=Nitzschia inconspicua TaxID=303405 RepID=A0A9K3L031_9STRA|nr:hypothetical protein IV203_008353 [Nitzschia inconspicua]
MSSGFTRKQQAALAVIPKISASLSFLGSSWIVIEVLTRKSKRQNVYNRLLCAMSCFDIASASWMFASTWPIPQNSQDVAFAVGNQTTCEIQGFFIQIGIIPFLYNSCLAIYFLLVVHYNIPEERLRFNIEPVMHIFSISFGLLTSLSALFMRLYNNANLWCWISSYPSACVGDECVRGRDDFEVFRWGFFYIPLWSCALVVTVTMIFIYRTVRQREFRAISDSQNARGRRTSLIRPSLSNTPFHQSVVFGNNPSFRFSIFLGGRNPSSVPSKQPQAETNTTTIKGRLSSKGVINTAAQSNDRASSVAERRSSMIMPRKMAEMFKPMNSRKVNEIHESDAEFVLQTIEALPSAREQAVEMNTFGSPIDGQIYFPIIFLHAMLLPLQGLFNFMVYRYYFFNRLRQRNPHMSFWELMRWTCRWTFLGPPPGAKPMSERDRSPTPSSKIRSLFSSNGKSCKQSTKGQIVRENHQRDMTSESAGGEIGGVSFGPDGSVMINNDDPNVLIDDLMGQEQQYDQYLMDFLCGDLLMSYGEFPNTLTEDPVVVTANFPTMIERDSYSHIPASGLANAWQYDHAPTLDGCASPYPNMFLDDVYD